MPRSYFWAATFLSACTSGPVCSSPAVDTADTKVSQVTPVRISENIVNKVDLLFVIDNSPGMAAKQSELTKEFPLFIDKLQSFDAMGNSGWYHIAVITSDLGAARQRDGGNRDLSRADLRRKEGRRLRTVKLECARRMHHAGAKSHHFYLKLRQRFERPLRLA